ncbi:MAG: hypothetical protein FJ106_12255 [Deltaproteobacteria bacterium]|nr:hypothetical protein [Deltaproteobacteria bacterium]
MLRYKHLRLDQDKIEKAKKVLGAKTETEAIAKALEKVVQADTERQRRRDLMKLIIQLRNNIGKIREDSGEWVRQARKKRALTHDIRA